MNRRAKITKIAAIATTPLAVVLAGGLVYQASFAAFTESTRNSGNEWSTGTIALTDDDEGSARFNVGNMLPNQTGQACIEVTATATVPSTVRGYSVNPIASTGGHLEEHIVISVEEGTGGSFADCEGFVSTGAPLIDEVALKDFKQFSDFENGMGGWSISSGTDKKTYQISYHFDVSHLDQSEIDSLQGQKTGLDFQWEMRTN